jgi:16S rRNA U1498 N3-methylase RsmE
MATVNLVLLEPDEIDDSGRARIGGARARHITQVLHTPPGGSLRAGIVGGGQGTATVIEAGVTTCVSK